jgi:hypothetical protein
MQFCDRLSQLIYPDTPGTPETLVVSFDISADASFSFWLMMNRFMGGKL